MSSEEPETVPFLLDNNTTLSNLTNDVFQPILVKSEEKLMCDQLNLFKEWNARRIELIKVQVLKMV